MGARFAAIIVITLGAVVASGCDRAETPPTTESQSVTDEQAVRAAEADFARALGTANGAAVDSVMDAEFTWVTPAGVFRPRASILAAVPQPAVGAERDLEGRLLGTNLFVTQRHDGKTHALHVWVRRAQGWRLLHVAEVTEGERVVYGGTMIGAAVCINPCTTVPFVPATPVERAVMESWQAQQSGPEQWAAHVPDDNVARTSNGTYTKADRMAVQLQQVQSGTIVSPSPLFWARIWEFGDAALMVALQPRAVGKPFLGSRVFELRNGTWVMAEAYQVTIQDTPPF